MVQNWIAHAHAVLEHPGAPTLKEMFSLITKKTPYEQMVIKISFPEFCAPMNIGWTLILPENK